MIIKQWTSACVLRTVIGALAAGGLVSCSIAADVPHEWKADCVGRMQLGLPGDIDIAANSAKMLEAEYRMGSIQPQFEFPDGQPAGWSSLRYFGRLYASAPLSDIERTRLKSAAEAEDLRARQYVHEKASQSGSKLVFETLSVKPHDGFASRVQTDLDASLFIGNRLVRLSSSGTHAASHENQQRGFETLLAGVSSRAIGSVPFSPGICIPYTFIRDDDRQWREIGVTYRLREHPDVTIFLKDATAATNPRKEVLTAKYRTNDFWGQYAGDTVKSAWFPVARDVKLAGQSGMATFVQFERKDGTEDYGYLAIAQGDPEAKEDIPDLMLYVIRDAKYAKAKGIEPVSKDALLKMAQTIAASVKRRPVSQ